MHIRNRIRSQPDPPHNTKKSELQMRMEAMASSCNGIALKSAQHSKGSTNFPSADSFARTEPPRSSSNALASYKSPGQLPTEKKATTGKKLLGIDPLQNCYGRPNRIDTRVPSPSPSQLSETDEGAPKGILSKPSTPKPATPKRVTWNLEANGFDPPPGSAGSSVTFGLSGQLPDVSGKRAKGQGKNKAGSLFQPQVAKPTRPSLSEQLSAIASKAGDITADIKAKAGIANPSAGPSHSSADTPIYQSPVKNFTVGTLQCRYAASAVFYKNRLEYLFHHPFEASEILLVLYYKDMQSLAISPNPQPGKMYFRVPRKLVHFASDYDPNKHFVVLYFSSSLSLQSVRTDVLPLISSVGSNSSSGNSSSGSTMEYSSSGNGLANSGGNGSGVYGLSGSSAFSASSRPQRPPAGKSSFYR